MWIDLLYRIWKNPGGYSGWIERYLVQYFFSVQIKIIHATKNGKIWKKGREKTMAVKKSEITPISTHVNWNFPVIFFTKKSTRETAFK